MQHLNLPEADLKLRRDSEGVVKVYDNQRRMWLVLTPEEWVRQNFVYFLINHKGYPSSLIANEYTINLNGTVKRCDTVVFDTELHPVMIVEYKAPSVEITREVFNQIGRYNVVLGVDNLVVSNGLRHYACRHGEDSVWRFLTDIPSWNELSRD